MEEMSLLKLILVGVRNTFKSFNWAFYAEIM